MKKWKLISSKIALDEDWFRIRQDKVKLPNGKVIDNFFVWLVEDVCMIIPVNKEGKFILTREYKYASGKIMTEFPMGLINKGEKPEKAALRELEEATGYIPKKMTLLGKIKQEPVKRLGDLFVYLAEDVVSSGRKKFDKTEDIEITTKTHTEVINMILNGKICNSASLASMFLFDKKFYSSKKAGK